MFVPNSTADALSLFPSQKEAARRLGVSPAAVCQWLAAGRVPTKSAHQIRRVLKGHEGFDSDAYLNLIAAEAEQKGAA